MTAPTFDCSHLTLPIRDVVPSAALGDPPPLPALTRPSDDLGLGDDQLRRVDDAEVDPLVSLVPSDRLVLTGAYRGNGWPSAIDATLVRRSVAHQLDQVIAALPAGFGLAIFDAWRPLALQAELYDAAYGHPGLPPGFVAEPLSDPHRPPPHLTGATVDLTLAYEGQPLALGTGFDDFTERAHADHLEGVDDDHPDLAARDGRRVLAHAMRGAGFVVLDCEWWHFETGTRYWSAVTGRPVRFAGISA